MNTENKPGLIEHQFETVTEFQIPGNHFCFARKIAERNRTTENDWIVYENEKIEPWCKLINKPRIEREGNLSFVVNEGVRLSGSIRKICLILGKPDSFMVRTRDGIYECKIELQSEETPKSIVVGQAETARSVGTLIP